MTSRINTKHYRGLFQLLNSETLAVIMLIITAVYAFFPSIITDMQQYNNVKYVVYAILAFLAYKTTFFKSINDKRILLLTSIIVFEAFLIFFFFSVGYTINVQDVVILAIDFLMIAIGYQYKGDVSRIDLLVIVFATMSVILGIQTIVYFVGTFTINEYLYAIEAKNQTGQIVASSAAALMVMSFSKKEYRFFKIILLVSLFVLSFLIRCRTATLALILFAVYFFYKAQGKKSFYVLLSVAGLTMIIFHNEVLGFLNEVFISDRDITDLDAVSTGRLERNVQGINFWMGNPLTGEMTIDSGVAKIHNYLINRLVAYGVFAFPFYVIFFYLLYIIIKGEKNKDLLNSEKVGYWTMVIPFFCSLLEPSAPFGPGLVQAIPFFLLGFSMKKDR